MPLPTNVMQGGISGGSARAIVGGAINNAVSAAGTTQATGTTLTADVNNVSTVASGAGVTCPAVDRGSLVIYNSGANPLKVYPPTSAAINQLAVNGSMLLQQYSAVVITYVTATQLLANLSA